jgi:hypothetical protein
MAKELGVRSNSMAASVSAGTSVKARVRGLPDEADSGDVF